MLVTAAFHTETVAGVIPVGRTLTTSGRLHDLGSGITTLALLAAAVLSARSLSHVRRFKLLVIALVLGAIGSNIGLLLIGRSVGGVRERILIAIGCGWQAAYLLVAARRRSDHQR